MTRDRPRLFATDQQGEGSGLSKRSPGESRQVVNPEGIPVAKRGRPTHWLNTPEGVPYGFSFAKPHPKQLNPVERAQLRAKVANERLGRKGASGDPLDQFGGRIALPLLVDLRA